MKTSSRILGACAALLLAAGSLRAAEWTEDYAGALAKAKKEHKLVLLDFTGSDWCIWCKRIDADVFSTKKFQDYAAKGLVLVTLDFPRTHPQKDDIKARNGKLGEKFEIQGFPTLVIMDPSEKVVYRQDGYDEGGVDALLGHLPKVAD
jgi:protein disulfide-isomerase